MRIITFLSDFGEDDWFVAAVKGEILKIKPNVHIIDITHRIKPHDIGSAAFILKSVFRNFPPGTVHLVVIDPGVGSKRKPIIVHAEPYYFTGPDNGVFSYVYNKHAKVYSIKVKGEVSDTFHARDIFGPVAARLASGDVPSSFGGETHDYLNFEFPRVTKKGKRLYGEVVYIDHFGNLIINIPNTMGLQSLCISGKDIPVKYYYGEGDKGQIICVKGSSGYYEIACNKGNAKELLGVNTGEKITAKL
ncbi:MAG: SAM-dependent chlorinase/fluorinase [bacterium]